jgi:predicted anti-sigma-YlaC factor YlaD
VFLKTKPPTSCRHMEARLEDYLGGAPDSAMEQHLAQCAACRSALEDSRLAGNLLRQAMEPSTEPRPAFLAGVMSRIREEKARAESPAAFWRPLEFLASRLALTAAVVLLALSAYLVEFAPGRNLVQVPSQTELNASDFPQPPGDPVSNEEVLQSLAERENGR